MDFFWFDFGLLFPRAQEFLCADDVVVFEKGTFSMTKPRRNRGREFVQSVVTVEVLLFRECAPGNLIRSFGTCGCDGCQLDCLSRARMWLPCLVNLVCFSHEPEDFLLRGCSEREESLSVMELRRNRGTEVV